MAREAPALVMEKQRLARIGGRFLGIIGDANHSFGYHVAASSLPGNDYSVQGQNRPIKDRAASCAIDIGMNWAASRDWLRWLITEIRDDRIRGIAEVIGSYDGRNVRYWSDSSGWGKNGVAYTGTGHDTWTHVAIYRSDIATDRGLLKGWTATGREDDTVSAQDVWTSVTIPKIDPDSGTTSAMRPASYLAWNHEYAKQQLAQGREILANQAALLAAVGGGDVAATVRTELDRAAERERAERRAELGELVAQLDEITALVEQVGSGELAADEVVRLIGERLTSEA